MSRRIVIACLAQALLLGQVKIPVPEPAKQPRPQPGQLATEREQKKEEPVGTTITVTTKIVQAPTIVYDAGGRAVNGLQLHNFEVFDNDKPQEFKLDVAFQPIDVVVAVQADAVAEDVLPKIKKIGSLLENLVAGEQGSVAVIAFDHRIRVMTDFTNDGVKIKKALEGINAGSSSARQIDAVNDAVRMLGRRGKDRRRILLLISETRDKGSEGKLKQTLTEAEMRNVQVYTVNMSRFLNTLLAKTPLPRPPAIPAEARHSPTGATMTPTELQQYNGTGNVLPAFVEIFRQAKAIFISNPAEVLTKYTGGREFGFVSQKGLEDAIAAIGDELHSQYLISYTPNNQLEGGWHSIRIVARREGGNLKDVRTRPGYWMAAVPNQ
ncbi:MAG: VWA domain-containing protein [Acidobacteria bacterium]|nr:VWA domain-containing protein [Acidobacteriota bacterium]